MPAFFRGHRPSSSLFFNRLHLSVFQYIRDSFAYMAVTIWICSARHLLIFFLIEEPRKLGIDYLLRGADQLQRSRLDALRTLSGITHHQYRLKLQYLNPGTAVSLKTEQRYCITGMTVQNRPEYSLSPNCSHELS